MMLQDNSFYQENAKAGTANRRMVPGGHKHVYETKAKIL